MNPVTFQIEHKTICSIFFLPVKVRRPFHSIVGGGWSTCVEFPAVKRGEYLTRIVTPFMQMTSTTNGNQVPMGPYPADEWAADVVQEVCGNHPFESVGGPGIFVCAGDKPTEEELATAEIRQKAWARKLVVTAQDLWAQGKKGSVSDLHRLAADWLGDTNYEWVRPPQDVKMIPCPVCTRLIENSKIECPHCGNIVDADAYMDRQIRLLDMTARLKQRELEWAKKNPELATAMGIAAGNAPASLDPATAQKVASIPVPPVTAHKPVAVR